MKLFFQEVAWKFLELMSFMAGLFTAACFTLLPYDAMAQEPFIGGVGGIYF